MKLNYEKCCSGQNTMLNLLSHMVFFLLPIPFLDPLLLPLSFLHTQIPSPCFLRSTYHPNLHHSTPSTMGNSTLTERIDIIFVVFP